MNGVKDFLLFERLHAEALECFPCPAVRADKGFIVLPGKRRRLTVCLTAFGTYLFSYIIFLHTLSLLSYRQAPVPETFYQI